MSEITEQREGAMNTDMSAEINEIAAALAKAQGKIEGAMKDKTNPHFRSSYADLASVWDACREQLSSNGLALVQTTDGNDPDRVTVVTTLLHTSGQWMRGRLTMRPTKADPQGVGSVITYARRYALAAMVGVAPEDDDGNAASGTKPKPEAIKRGPVKPITKGQAADLTAMIDESGTDKANFCEYFKIDAVDSLPEGDYSRAVAMLQKKRAA